MADWTFGLGELPPRRAGRSNERQRKAAQAWLKAWAIKLTAWRESVKMSQSELAKKLEVSPMTVSRWVRGFARPTEDAVVRLTALLGEMETPSRAKPAKSKDPLLNLMENLTPGQQIAQLLTSLGKVFEKIFDQDSYPAFLQQKTSRRPAAKPKSLESAMPSISWSALIVRIQDAEGWAEGRNRRLADALGVAPSTISNWLKNLRRPRGAPRFKLLQLARQHSIPEPLDES